MNPKYSILLCGQSLQEYRTGIDQWLRDGIKVFWFGQEDDVKVLKEQYPLFAEGFFLQAYVCAPFGSCVIVDGNIGSPDQERVFAYIEQRCPDFNAAQYRVEHCPASDHIIVQASAGTGKTTVMIDRIMFLMHTVPDLHMSDIYMITFTNDATSQMNVRLQEMLLKRFRLTRKMRYLEWVEEQSRMNISTIHSFAFKMLREYGIGDSFTRNLSIRNFKYERKELIKDMMNDRLDDARSIRSQTGMSLYKANGLIDLFWKGFARLGIPHQDMLQMNWGKPADEKSASFHLIGNYVL